MMSYINKNNLMPERSRLFCPIERTNEEMYFSLVDYRNNYFTSSNPDKIIEFYNGFNNREQLIQWMRERPKGVANVHEVEGDKDIIVVIPTADFNGRYARECRENIFKGLHIVFVESGGRGDFYFNYAHNCNVGIRKAMEYNPKWVVVSNDDMTKIDKVEVLVGQLMKLDNKEYDVIFTKPSEYHSIPASVSEHSLIGKIIVHLIRRGNFNMIYRKLQRKYDITFSQQKRVSLIFKNKISFILTSDFAIFSSNWVSLNLQNIFDEQFINAYEDLDISIRLKDSRALVIDYKIGDLFGSSLGNGEARKLRSISSKLLLDDKIRKTYIKTKC